MAPNLKKIFSVKNIFVTWCIDTIVEKSQKGDFFEKNFIFFRITPTFKGAVQLL